MASRLRWLVLSVFVISTALNYLDRLLLAALAPTLKSEFHLSNTQYGGVISVFSIVYALTAPVAGWFIDRVGLNAGITVSMAVWSAAGMATGWTRSFGGLLASRTVLGIGEAAGIPCAGKANGVYLQPRELAFGTALNQVGITIGSIAAPLMVAVMAPAYGWRSVFVVCGALGFVWIPVWWATAKRFARSLRRPRRCTGGVVQISARRPHLGTRCGERAGDDALYTVDELDHAVFRRATSFDGDPGERTLRVDSAGVRHAGRIRGRVDGIPQHISGAVPMWCARGCASAGWRRRCCC